MGMRAIAAAKRTTPFIIAATSTTSSTATGTTAGPAAAATHPAGGAGPGAPSILMPPVRPSTSRPPTFRRPSSCRTQITSRQARFGANVVRSHRDRTEPATRFSCPAKPVCVRSLSNVRSRSDRTIFCAPHLTPLDPIFRTPLCRGWLQWRQPCRCRQSVFSELAIYDSEIARSPSNKSRPRATPPRGQSCTFSRSSQVAPVAPLPFNSRASSKPPGGDLTSPCLAAAVNSQCLAECNHAFQRC